MSLHQLRRVYRPPHSRFLALICLSVTAFATSPARATAQTNLALNRPAVASSTQATTSGGNTDPSVCCGAASANDGNTSSRWSSQFSDPQWWRVDLGSTMTVAEVVVDWETAYASHYQVQVSTDGTNYTTVANVSPTAAGNVTTTFAAVPARYVRIYGTSRATGWGYSIYEVQVYASSSLPPPPVNTQAPIITGTPQPGNAVTTTHGSWTNSPTSWTYHWQDCNSSGASCTSISGATSSSYTVQSSDVGHALGVVVTAANAGGSSAPATAHTTVVSNSSGKVTCCTTFLGNTFSGAGVSSNTTNVESNSIQNMAASSDGYLVTGSSWAENQHDIELYNSNGTILGPQDPTRNNGGTFGVAIDSNYIYAVSGLSIYKFNRQGSSSSAWQQSWMNPANITWYDDGNNATGYEAGPGPFTVDSGGSGWLMGITVCGNYLYVSDPGAGAALGDNGNVSPNTAQVKQIGPLSATGWGSVVDTWSVPRARSITCDREGDIWVLQQGTTDSGNTHAPAAERFAPNSNGTPLATISLQGIPLDIAADPTSDSIYATDNSQAQNVKIYNYSGTVTGTVGVTDGYLAGPTPGLYGGLRFCGPNTVAVDGSGNVYVGQSGMPGVNEGAWFDYGPIVIVTKIASNHSTVDWSDFSDGFLDAGSPSSDGQMFYGRDSSYVLQNGSYQPYAFTVNPFTYPSDNRVTGTQGSEYGESTRVWNADGHRYLVETDLSTNPFQIYEMIGQIAAPVVSFDNNSTLTTSGTTANVSSNSSLINNNGANDFFMDDNGNVWSVGGSQVWEYLLQGFDSAGVPQYGFAHVNTYPIPSQLSQSARRIVVHGNDVWMSGFASSDPDPDNEFDSWKSTGRHLLEFTSLPKTSGWPAPAWEDNFSYPDSTSLIGNYPTSWDVDPGVNQLAMSYLYDSNSDEGYIDVYNASSGGQTGTTYDPPVPSFGKVGWLDMQHSLQFVNGWIWAEDDWNIKTYGICPSGSC